MTLTIPNIEASPTFDGQAVPDATDWASEALAISNVGVLSGCGVTAQGSPNMTVAVAAGTVVIGGAGVAVATVASLAIGAASASDRKDIVVVNNAGTVSVVAGTACGTAGWTRTSVGLPPIKPAIPASSVLLAEVYVAATTTSIVAGNIVDKTTLTPSTVNLPNNSAISARNAAGSADIVIAKIDGSNHVSIDPGGANTVFGGFAALGNATPGFNTRLEVQETGQAALFQVRVVSHGTFRITVPNDATAVLLQTQNATDLIVRANGAGGITCKTTGSVELGATITTTSTDGFPYVPSTAGAPTGVPTTLAGYAAMQYDTTNHKVWFYDAGWKGVVVA